MADNRRRCLRLAAGAALFLVLAGAPAGARADDIDPLKLLHQCLRVCNSIKDFTAVFTKEEQVQGKILPVETTQMKLRTEPFSVYMHWIKKPHKGREVIYVAGKYDGKIVGHQPLGPLNFSQRSAPDAKSLMKRSRRPITQAGFQNAIKDIVRTTELGRQNNEILITYLGTEAIFDRPAHVIHRVFTRERAEYPVHLGVTYIDKEWMVPVKIGGYDRKGRLLGVYTYSDVKLNVGLTDTDFDIENPSYSFPGMLPIKKIGLPKKLKLPWPFGGKED